MPETTPLIKAALNLRGGAGFDVYVLTFTWLASHILTTLASFLLIRIKNTPFPNKNLFSKECVYISVLELNI